MTIIEQLASLEQPIADLNLDQANARIHSRKNIDAVKASLARFGQRQPLVVQKEGMVVRAGNCRLIAAKELGWQTIAAVIVDESSVDATAYAIADNRTGELAEWDFEALGKLVETLPDLDAIGFEQDELDSIIGSQSWDALSDLDLDAAGEQREKRIEKLEQFAVIKFRVPRANEELARERLASLAIELGGEVIL